MRGTNKVAMMMALMATSAQAARIEIGADGRAKARAIAAVEARDDRQAVDAGRPMFRVASFHPQAMVALSRKRHRAANTHPGKRGKRAHF